jgi:hypothetical protein
LLTDWTASGKLLVSSLGASDKVHKHSQIGVEMSNVAVRGDVYVLYLEKEDWTYVFANQAVYVNYGSGDWLTQIVDAIGKNAFKWSADEKTATYVFAGRYDKENSVWVPDPKGVATKGLLMWTDKGLITPDELPDIVEQARLALEKERIIKASIAKRKLEKGKEDARRQGLIDAALADARPMHRDEAERDAVQYKGSVHKSERPTVATPLKTPTDDRIVKGKPKAKARKAPASTPASVEIGMVVGNMSIAEMVAQRKLAQALGK